MLRSSLSNVLPLSGCQYAKADIGRSCLAKLFDLYRAIEFGMQFGGSGTQEEVGNEAGKFALVEKRK